MWGGLLEFQISLLWTFKGIERQDTCAHMKSSRENPSPTIGTGQVANATDSWLTANGAPFFRKRLASIAAQASATTALITALIAVGHNGSLV